MNSLLRGKLGLAAFLLLGLFVIKASAATDVFFDVTAVFGTPSPNNTNRIFRLQSLSPFQGNFFYRTSDVSGQFYVSNALATTYSGTMLAPPNSLTFSFYVSATNLGTIPAVGITAIPANGAQTFPAGQTAYSAQASDQRYAPIGSGPFAGLTAVQTTNLIQNATNSLLQAITNSIDVSVIRADNLILPFGNAVMKANASSNAVAAVAGTDYDAGGAATAATNGMTSIVYSNAVQFVGTNLLTVTSNALQSQITSGISAATATNVVNASTGVISTNGNSLAFKFSSTGTNAIQAMAQTISDTSSNLVLANSQTSINTSSNSVIGTMVTATNKLVVKTNGFATGLTSTNTLFLGQTRFGNGSPNALIGADGSYEIVGGGTFLASDGSGEFATGGITWDASGNLVANSFTGSGSGVTDTTATNLTGTGLIIVTNVANARVNVASNSLVAQIAVKADTNSPTIFTPTVNGGTFNTITNNNNIYFTAGVFSPSHINASALGLTVSPSGGGGIVIITGDLRATNISTLSSGIFSGNGAGITNAASTNLQGTALNQVTNIASSLITTSVGITNAVGTNFPNGNVANSILYYPTNFVIPTNGFAINLTSTNNTALEGNIAFGPVGGATNIYSSTNVLKVFNAGSAIATNGTLIWNSALNCYTNWSTSAIYTNNGSAWLLQTNGVTLYSVSGSSPAGTSTAVSGAAPPPTVVISAYLDGNGFAIFGPLSVTNITSISNSIVTNLTGYAVSNFIANLGGFGTNGRLYNTRLISTDGLERDNANNFQGAQIDFGSAAFGQANTNIASGFGAAILSGTTNRINLDGAGVVVGGSFNALGGGSGNADVIIGGSSNVLTGIGGIGAIGGNLIGAGYKNTLGSAFFSSVLGGTSNSLAGSYAAILGGWGNTNFQDGGIILGGQTNRNNGKWSIASGRNVTISHDSVNSWSDGIPDTSITNSQHRITATNGMYLNGPLTIGIANTNSGIFFKSNTFALWPYTNSLGVGDFVHANSNGFPVQIWNSNGTVVMKNLFP